MKPQEIRQALKEPFRPQDIEWRIQWFDKDGAKRGQPRATCVPYITARAVQDRLDDAVGPENWQTKIESPQPGVYICTLRVCFDGRWISKADGSNATQIEAVKGGISGAIKRAAVHFGIGRYLYGIDIGFCEFTPKGIYTHKDKANKKHAWNPPHLPPEALPAGFDYGGRVLAAPEPDAPNVGEDGGAGNNRPGDSAENLEDTKAATMEAAKQFGVSIKELTAYAVHVGKHDDLEALNERSWAALFARLKSGAVTDWINRNQNKCKEQSA